MYERIWRSTGTTCLLPSTYDFPVVLTVMPHLFLHVQFCVYLLEIHPSSAASCVIGHHLEPCSCIPSIPALCKADIPQTGLRPSGPHMSASKDISRNDVITREHWLACLATTTPGRILQTSRHTDTTAISWPPAFCDCNSSRPFPDYRWCHLPHSTVGVSVRNGKRSRAIVPED